METKITLEWEWQTEEFDFDNEKIEVKTSEIEMTIYFETGCKPTFDNPGFSSWVEITDYEIYGEDIPELELENAFDYAMENWKDL